eukprot:753088-Hanusia_phi.AAC.14
MLQKQGCNQGQSVHFLAAAENVNLKVTRAGMQGVGIQESELLFEMSKRPGFEGSNIIYPYSAFEFEDHWCLVLEKMHGSLHEVIEQIGPFALSMECLQKLSFQLLTSLSFLASNGIVHADIRPENVLLRESPWKKATGRDASKPISIKVKLADMGNSFRIKNSSAYHDDFELQTLCYRAPEVLFGMPFSTQIDMWSLGCLLVEVYIGRRLFDSFNRSSAVATMAKTLGKFPRALFSSGKYYEALSALPVFHSKEQVEEQGIQCQIASLLQSNNLKLISFISGCLEYDPDKRLTPHQALCHPFLSSLCPLPVIIRDTLMTVSPKLEAAKDKQDEEEYKGIDLCASAQNNTATRAEVNLSLFAQKLHARTKEAKFASSTSSMSVLEQVKPNKRVRNGWLGWTSDLWLQLQSSIMRRDEHGDSPLRPKATRPREYSRVDVGRADKTDVKINAKGSGTSKHHMKAEESDVKAPVKLTGGSSGGSDVDVRLFETESTGSASKARRRKRKELDSSPEPLASIPTGESTPGAMSEEHGGRRRLSDRVNKGLKPQAWWVTENQEMEAGGERQEMTAWKREGNKGKRESIVVKGKDSLFRMKE